jgi:hypothetical protein
MKTKLLAPLLGLFLSVSAVATVASDKVNVQSSRDLRVTVVDQTKEKTTRDMVQAALMKSLSAGLTHECKAPAQVKMKNASASRAAKELKNGECDALIVIGNSVPSGLLEGGVTVLKANGARAGTMDQTFYLLGHPRDPGMNKVLGLAFDHAIKSTAFQEALVGKSSGKSGLAVADR